MTLALSQSSPQKCTCKTQWDHMTWRIAEIIKDNTSPNNIQLPLPITCTQSFFPFFYPYLTASIPIVISLYHKQVSYKTILT